MNKLKGLYAITDASLKGPHGLARQVELAILGGAKVIQYRDKGTDARARLNEASELLQICRRHRVPLLINDDVTLATAIDADGVHIGREDEAFGNARRQLGSNRIIGVSCYNDINRATQAAAQGADYVAFGRFFTSDTKPEAMPADIGQLQRAKAELSIPVVAIGGITPENGRALVEAGADMLAVIRALFGAGDITGKAQAFNKLF